MLGVRAVLAESYERIHRSNLIGMGVLPVQFARGESWRTLDLKGDETYDIAGLSDDLQPGQTVRVTATSPLRGSKAFDAVVRIDGPVELEYYRNGGILQTVVRRMAKM